MDKERIIEHVANMVADSVEAIYAVNGREGSVDREHLFDGQRTAHNVTARFFLFRTLHDIYGFSYADISNFSGIGKRNVMRAVSKVREYIFNDAIYSTIKDEIGNRISQGL